MDSLVGQEIYLDRDLSKEFEVPYFHEPDDSLSSHGREFRHGSGYRNGRWDSHHRAIFEKLGGFRAQPGGGPGWWMIVEIYN